MNALVQPVEARFEPLEATRLDAVVAVEQSAYAHPWSRRNFTDALASGYQAQLLMAGDDLLGYFVAMSGVDEVHLLNITVAPAYQRQGWAMVMLDALAIWARGQRAGWLWLEVRSGNLRALQIYEAHGFRRVGLRKAYYPAGHGQREDALVMSLSYERRGLQGLCSTRSDKRGCHRMSLDLDKRQRAMLGEMGVRVWTPEPVAGPARVEAAPRDVPDCGRPGTGPSCDWGCS